MAISSSGRGLQPGVCTSTTRPSAPYEGQMVYETDTDKVLVWNGSAWVYSLTPQTLEPGVWTTYTPTLTNMTLGNGTLTGRYCRIGKTVFVHVRFVLGSTSSIGSSGGCTMSNPVTSYAYGGTPNLGNALYLDSGNLLYFGFVPYTGTTTVGFGYDVSNRYQEIYNVGPFTWGTNDEIVANWSYEAA